MVITPRGHVAPTLETWAELRARRTRREIGEHLREIESHEEQIEDLRRQISELQRTLA